MPSRARKNPDGYVTETRGAVTAVILRSMRDWIIDDVMDDFRSVTPSPAAAGANRFHGRGSHFAYHARCGGPDIVVRRYRRGGFASFLGRSSFPADRSLNELFVTTAASAAGVRVPSVVAIRVEKVPPGRYRHTIATREIAGAGPLRAFLKESSAGRRRAVAAAVGRELLKLHAAGVDHVDLTIDNILVGDAEGTPLIYFLDFDRARVVGEISPSLVDRRIRRLFRSVEKWPSAGRRLTRADRMRFLHAYFGERSGVRRMAGRCSAGLWLHRLRWNVTGAGRES